MAETNLSAETLRNHLSYDPETGIFVRIGYPCDKVGRITTKGYRQISVAGTRATAHRMAWMYVHGEWPSGQIDHINQCKDDNRIENLRVVSNKQNGENITVYGHNTSGHRGVRFTKCKWIAEIKHKKKSMHLGSFASFDEAVAARLNAEQMFFTHAPITHKITHPSVSH